ncbi:MAG: glycoside hydrolase family 9 protein, partial [Bacteroidales bacterium]|nr:glycoside hydrolase family 9 protein [Bacteroidales bacterium]
MKTAISVFLFCVFLPVLNSCSNKSESWIRINQMGYRTGDIKCAVFISSGKIEVSSFSIIDAKNGRKIKTLKSVTKAEPLHPFVSCYRLNFSELQKEGIYRIVAGKTVSPDFKIADDVYDETADFLLNYMRQQRCGFNPYRNASCHLNDGYEIYGPENDSVHIDVTGGWHDAADYLQYVATSANATYQMLFAWQKNPEAFTDKYLPDGLPGSDGTP